MSFMRKVNVMSRTALFADYILSSNIHVYTVDSRYLELAYLE